MGDFPGHPEPMWYDPDGIANIISLKQAKKYFVINYHSKEWNGFVVNQQENVLV